MTRALLARAATAGVLALLAHAAQAATIVVGQVGPMSGMEATQGRAYATGMELLFNSVNKAGGVNGHTFTLVRKDDGGRPEDTVSMTRELLAQNKPLVLAGYFGNKNIADLVASGLLEKEKIPLVGYRSWEIRGETPLLYNVRAGLREELNKLTEHLATIGITKLGLLYEAGPGAASLLAAAEQSAKQAKAQIGSHATYDPGTTKVNAAVDQLVKAQPQAILVVASGAAAAAFIEQYRASGGVAQIFTHSGADVEQMAKRLGEEQLQGVAIAQVTPSPYKISSRIAKELNDIAAASGKLEVPLSYAMMEGFITAKVIVEAVRRQRAPSREGMVAALDSIDRLDLGGYMVGFKPGQRTGSKFVELSIVNNTGKIRQ
ncbi:ABC transporter substrate-binding protein [Ramlibacter sp. PS4R-6]|uniref:ABC transporter substrate-binding protein n=1 Tax=Ramlibacter sp. PS4R-6 TaxID=3133438 RepID=UPI00309E635F